MTNKQRARSRAIVRLNQLAAQARIRLAAARLDRTRTRHEQELEILRADLDLAALEIAIKHLSRRLP